MTQVTAKKSYIKDADGSYVVPYVNPADNTNLGVVKPDGSTIKTAADGTISTNNTGLSAITAYANEGELLTDADGLSFVETYAHSTFDLSKFTVVGSPNITDDGIASGFSGSNAVRVIVDTSSANSIEFDGSFIYTTYSSAQDLLQYVNAFYKFYIQSTGNIIAHFQNSAGSWFEEIVVNPANYGITVGTKVYYKMFLYKNEGYRRLYISTDGINYSLVGTVTSTNTSPFVNNLNLYYGVAYGSPFTDIYQGSMDLKDISVKLDGIPVFSGNKTGIDTYIINSQTVNIPYTWSSENNKIVDAYYRSDVSDLFDLQGFAPYITLDEDNGNFTLPMGNLYGMIGQSNIIDIYRSGITYWNLYSDKTLEIGGTCTSGVEYNLPKAFADTNYILTIPYSAKTTTTFTPTESGDFIAKGVCA